MASLPRSFSGMMKGDESVLEGVWRLDAFTGSIINEADAPGFPIQLAGGTILFHTTKLVPRMQIKLFCDKKTRRRKSLHLKYYSDAWRCQFLCLGYLIYQNIRYGERPVIVKVYIIASWQSGVKVWCKLTLRKCQANLFGLVGFSFWNLRVTFTVAKLTPRGETPQQAPPRGMTAVPMGQFVSWHVVIKWGIFVCKELRFNLSKTVGSNGTKGAREWGRS